MDQGMKVLCSHVILDCGKKIISSKVELINQCETFISVLKSRLEKNTFSQAGLDAESILQHPEWITAFFDEAQRSDYRTGVEIGCLDLPLMVSESCQQLFTELIC